MSRTWHLQTQCMAGVKSIALHLQDEALRSHVIHACQIRDTVQGSVPMATIMPVLCYAFHRRWSAAELHQAALMRAVDIDNTGLLTWDLWALAAEFALHTCTSSGIAGNKLPDEQLRAHFLRACALSGKQGVCSLEHGKAKLFACVNRLWTFSAMLPEGCVCSSAGVWVLPQEHAYVVHEDATRLQASIVKAMEVCGSNLCVFHGPCSLQMCKHSAEVCAHDSAHPRRVCSVLTEGQCCLQAAGGQAASSSVLDVFAHLTGPVLDQCFVDRSTPETAFIALQLVRHLLRKLEAATAQQQAAAAEPARRRASPHSGSGSMHSHSGPASPHGRSKAAAGRAEASGQHSAPDAPALPPQRSLAAMRSIARAKTVAFDAPTAAERALETQQTRRQVAQNTKHLEQ